MNELENSQRVLPEEVPEIIQPAGSAEMAPAGEPEKGPAESQSAPPPGKPKRVAEKFGTGFWWGLFVAGLLLFFGLNAIFWGLVGFSPELDMPAAEDLMCAGPLWIILNLLPIAVFSLLKLNAAIFGYISGYILNFILTLFMQTVSGAVCGEPFFMSFIR